MTDCMDTKVRERYNFLFEFTWYYMFTYWMASACIFWVMGEENRLDFARRMQQFFDHYLKGEPMPVWMAKGIPAVDKGKKFGFEPFEKN